MKILIKTLKNSILLTGDYSEGYLCERDDDRLTLPPDRWVAVDISAYPIKEGYRPVTEEEKEKYLKPECAMFYFEKNYICVLDNKQWPDSFYIIPEDFNFEPVYRDVIDEDVGEMVMVKNFPNKEWQKREFIGIMADKTYLCWKEDYSNVVKWKYARIKEKAQ